MHGKLEIKIADLNIQMYSKDECQLDEYGERIDGVMIHEYQINNDVDEYVGFAGMLIPTEYALHDNYPNPFNPITNIKYDIPENTHVTIAVYNTLGQHVIDLVNEEQAAGYYHMQWNGLNKRGTPVGSGLYFYRLTTSEFTQSEKMTYLK